MDQLAVNQYDIPERSSKLAVFDAQLSKYIPEYISRWSCTRIVLVASKGLYTAHNHIQDLETLLGSKIVAKKIGVGEHSPYADVIAIAHMLQEYNADCLVSIGSSSYSDASKIAALLAATLPSGFTAKDMESLVDQRKGHGTCQAAKVKVILVPTSLSASEWNGSSSCTNPDGKKQHFSPPGGHRVAVADLILLDPELASTAPERLWLSSGVRCMDHCVETICNPHCTPPASADAQEGLAAMLKGLLEYKQGEGADRARYLRGISDSQQGARRAIMALIVHRNSFGPSHAIGHQLGSVSGVMHGITSCILLAPVLKYQARDPSRREAQATVLKVFNETLGWRETEAADAVTKFVKLLGLRTRLEEVGVTDEGELERIAAKTLTDVWGGGVAQITEAGEVMKILDLAR
ncbi:hypothetical protein LTR62_007471 [Meristemomyces frigidus]|uniref:Alcohol dehydrogenase iron-type/glycerol dehydrogenase GldA domain-containing protein n=1 Tax=Meristemomyces frigidus TaxID=1508187 RepID=A0AAN7TQ47_9PEZI|nr:hypothetical protein LTR62_007471 [Meristemomyces frigidus]